MVKSRWVRVEASATEVRFDVDGVLAALQTVLPTQDAPLALHEPRFQGNESAYVTECLRTGWVSTAGRFVDRLEAELASCCGVNHAVACVSGTAALHVALRLAGVSAGDEALVPALTFVATANAVAYCGAVPHLVDSDRSTLGVDPDRLAEYLADIGEVSGGVCRNRRTGRRIAAVVPVHVFGHPVRLDALLDVAQRFGLTVVEDATESLGSSYRGRPMGGFGQMGVLSFNGNKIITSGGGGAILTDDDRLAASAKHLTTTAKLPHAWAFNHDQLGYNYRLPNINAALGCAQLEQLGSFVEQKRRLADRYRQAFASRCDVQFIDEPAGARSNFWLNGVLIDPRVADPGARDLLLERTQAAKISTRPAWTLMSRLPMYQDCPKMDLSVAEDLQARIVSLPSSVGL